MVFLSKEQFNLFRVTAIRGLSVLLAALVGFISLKVFIGYNDASAATYIAVFGWMAFIPLAQMGLGRPTYSIARKLYSLDQVSPFQLLGVFDRFSILGIVCVAAMAVGVQFIAQSQGFMGGKFDLTCFAAGMAAITVCSYHRDLAYAFDLVVRYELAEVIRRLSLVVAIGMIWIGLRPGIAGGVLTITAFLTIVILRQRFICKLGGESEVDDKKILNRFSIKNMARDAVLFLGYSVNEALLYNAAVVVFTVTGDSRGLILCGIWNKIFLIFVLPARIYIDTLMNKIVSAYHGEDFLGCRALINRCAAFALVLSSACALGYFLVAERLIVWLGRPEFLADNWVLPSLLLWAFGNVFQHAFGGFYASVGGNFHQCLLVSAIGVVLVVGLFLIANFWMIGFGLSMFISGLGYCSCAWVYFCLVSFGLLDKASR